MVRKSDKVVSLKPEKDYIHVEDGRRVITITDPKIAQKLCQMVDDTTRMKSSTGSGVESDFLLWTYIGSIFPETMEHANWSLRFIPVTKPKIFEMLDTDKEVMEAQTKS
jgi:hypothetical protein